MVKRKLVLDELDKLETKKKETLIHESFFTSFLSKDNELLMKFKNGGLTINLNNMIEDFIEHNKNSKVQEVINEVEFKRADLQNIDDFSKYSITGIRYAYSSHFFELTDLFYNGFISDSNIDFKNEHIKNKYEFVFKNLGIHLKPVKENVNFFQTFASLSKEKVNMKEITKIYKEVGVQVNFEKNFNENQKNQHYFEISKLLKDKNFYILKIKPKILMLNPGGSIGRIKRYHSYTNSKVFNDHSANARFFFLTKKSFDYLEKILDKNKTFPFDRFKMHLDPDVYFNDYYDLKELLNHKLFDYNFYNVNYSEVKKISFMIPNEKTSYLK